MRTMSTDYLESGRARQKQRTRDQLIAAARELITAGETPRVEEVAEAAGISRPTAYRYFASQAELLAAAYPETEPRPPSRPAAGGRGERVAAVAEFVIGRVQETEPQQRAMLRLSLGEVPHELPLRQGRVIPWFVEALEPLAESIGDESVHRLAFALRATCGIETRVWLSDVAGLAPAEVSALQQWMVEALVKQALETPPTPRSARPREPHREVRDPVLDELLTVDGEAEAGVPTGQRRLRVEHDVPRGIRALAVSEGGLNEAVGKAASARCGGEDDPSDPPRRDVVQHPGVAEQVVAVAEEHVRGAGLDVAAVEVGVGALLLHDEHVLAQPGDVVDLVGGQAGERCDPDLHVPESRAYIGGEKTGEHDSVLRVRASPQTLRTCSG